jgi:hypothetical protein
MAGQTGRSLFNLSSGVTAGVPTGASEAREVPKGAGACGIQVVTSGTDYGTGGTVQLTVEGTNQVQQVQGQPPQPIDGATWTPLTDGVGAAVGADGTAMLGGADQFVDLSAFALVRVVSAIAANDPQEVTQTAYFKADFIVG